MSEGTLLVEADLTEARTKAKDVREQLRALENVLSALVSDVSDKSSLAAGRLTRVRLNVSRAIEEIKCTESTQMPF
jgi:hypothetical protein